MVPGEHVTIIFAIPNAGSQRTTDVVGRADVLGVGAGKLAEPQPFEVMAMRRHPALTSVARTAEDEGQR